MKKFITHWTFTFVTLVILTFIGLQEPYVKEILKLKSFDILIQQEEQELSKDIGIVTIDEKSIEKYGQWPWKRDVIAEVISNLRQSGAGVIMIPILFSEEDRLGGDDILSQTLIDNGVVIAQVGTSQINKNSVPRGVAKIGNPLPYLFEWDGMLGPIPKLGQNANGVGVINTAPEIDGVGVIMIPILFSEEDRLGGDDILAQTLVDNGVVIAQVGTSQIDKNSVPRGVARIGNPFPYLFEWEGMLGPIEKLGQNANGVGVINTAPEIDGVVRRIPLIMKIVRTLGISEGELSTTVEEKTYPTMAVEVIRVATGAPSYQVKSGEGGIQAIRVPGFPIINTDPNARIWLHWNKEFETISASENDFSKFNARTVIIGTTAEGLGGIIATPVGEQYDYMLSASTLQTMIDGKQINRYDISSFLELVLSFVLGILVILIARFTPYWFVGLSLLSLYGMSVYGSYYLFNQHLILSDISWIIIVITIVGMHSIFNRFILEFRLKQQIRKQFVK